MSCCGGWLLELHFSINCSQERRRESHLYRAMSIYVQTLKHRLRTQQVHIRSLQFPILRRSILDPLCAINVVPVDIYHCTGSQDVTEEDPQRVFVEEADIFVSDLFNHRYWIFLLIRFLNCLHFMFMTVC